MTSCDYPVSPVAAFECRKERLSDRVKLPSGFQQLLVLAGFVLISACGDAASAPPDESDAVGDPTLPICEAIPPEALNNVSLGVFLYEECMPLNYEGAGALVRQQVSLVTGEPTIGHFELSDATLSPDCAELLGFDKPRVLLIGHSFVPEVDRVLQVKIVEAVFFQRTSQIAGVDEVVFDGVAGTGNVGAFKACDGAH